MTNEQSAARIAIIGAGHVGATAAYALMLRALVREIVLIDNNMALALAEAGDISDANALARPARIWAGTYDDAASAAIAVITAGAATHGDESRLSVLSRSAGIVRACVESLMAAGFNGIVLVAANPVDVMTHLAFNTSKLAANRVIGTGTLLDTSRLRSAIATKLDIAPRATTGLVLGEHGDSEVIAFSTVRAGEQTLPDYVGSGELPDYVVIASEVREAAYRIISGKGYTSFGVATAIVSICEAIIRNERTVLPVSTMLTGEYGIHDIFLSLPCVLGMSGVARVLQPNLTEGEQEALRASAYTIRKAMAELPDQHAR